MNFTYSLNKVKNWAVRLSVLISLCILILSLYDYNEIIKWKFVVFILDDLNARKLLNDIGINSSIIKDNILKKLISIFSLVLTLLFTFIRTSYSNTFHKNAWTYDESDNNFYILIKEKNHGLGKHPKVTTYNETNGEYYESSCSIRIKDGDLYIYSIIDVSIRVDIIG